MSNVVTNCPNCGAPLTAYGTCEYCGTTISHPIQFIATPRPGVRKLVCQVALPYDLGTLKPEAATKYAMNDVRNKMAEALTDSIKFVTRSEFDPRRFAEVIIVRGELWVADPSVNY